MDVDEEALGTDETVADAKESDAEDFDEYADYADEEDYDEADIYTYTYHEPSPAQQRATNFRIFAELVEDLARYVDTFNVNCTTDDNTVHRLPFDWNAERDCGEKWEDNSIYL